MLSKAGTTTIEKAQFNLKMPKTKIKNDGKGTQMIGKSINIVHYIKSPVLKST